MNELLVLPSDKKYDYYIHEDEWMLCLEKLSGMILGSDVKEQEKELARVAHGWLTKAKQVYKVNLSARSDRELIAWFKEFSNAYAWFAFYAFTPWAVDFVLAPRLFAYLNSKDSEKAKGWFDTISTSTRYNRMTQQRINLLQIAISGNGGNLRTHTKKYFWLPVYNIGDNAWTEKDFEKELNEIQNPQEELTKIKESFEQRKRDYKAVLKEINPDKEIKRLIEVVHLYTFLRNERVDQWRICFVWKEGNAHQVEIVDYR